MPEDKTEEIFNLSPRHQAVDVFTHSRIFPGAWSEEEIKILIDTWEDILKITRCRHYSVSKELFRRLAEDERIKNANKEEDVAKQMKTLRTEYCTYLGLQTLNIETVKPDYKEQLDQIFGTFPKFQQRPPQGHHLRTVYVPYGDEDQMTFNYSRSDKEINRRRRRSKNFNLEKLCKTMTDNHNTMMKKHDNMMEETQRLFESLQVSNAKNEALLEELIELRRSKSC